MPHLSPATVTTDDQRLILRATAGNSITARALWPIVAAAAWETQLEMWRDVSRRQL